MLKKGSFFAIQLVACLYTAISNELSVHVRATLDIAKSVISVINNEKRKIGWLSAGAIVVANMIGTGVFTGLGMQLRSLENTWTILSLWFLGGVLSLFGAFSYAELGARLPRSGGEYHFLSRIFHPLLGYLSGWVSLTVGFSASVALSAMAMSAYLAAWVPISKEAVAVGAIVCIAAVHSVSIRQSSTFQNGFTLLKLLLVVALIVGGIFIPQGDNAVDWSSGWRNELGQADYIVSLVYVIYAFSGWNAAAYIVDEIRSPARNLPRALVGGTLLVGILYVLLQFSFLNQAPREQLLNKIEVGQVVASTMMGPKGGQIISFLIAFLLIAGISAMIWVGPRVARAMAGDYPIWRFFAKDNHWGVPVRAIWLQTGISVFMVATSSFEKVLLYSGFVLQLFSTLTVAGLLVVRWRGGSYDGYKSPAFPWVQIIYLVFSFWVMIYLLWDKPLESLLGLVNVAAGALSYWWNKHADKKIIPNFDKSQNPG